MPLQQRSSGIDRERLAKATFLHQVKEKHKFHTSHAVLLISVGQPVHEGERLRAVIQLINKNFKSCDIAVCDVLQRHSMQITKDIDEEQAYKECLSEGRKWLERNQEYIKELQIEHNILTWEEFLLRKDFQTHIKDILDEYSNNINFKDAMQNSINDYVSRLDKRVKALDTQKAIDCCFNYLAEESAIIMKMWQERAYDYIVYPGNIPKVLEAARDKFVVFENIDLLKWVTVYVRSRSSK